MNASVRVKKFYGETLLYGIVEKITLKSPLSVCVYDFSVKWGPHDIQ